MTYMTMPSTRISVLGVIKFTILVDPSLVIITKNSFCLVYAQEERGRFLKKYIRTHGFETGRYICYGTGSLILSSNPKHSIDINTWKFFYEGWCNYNKKSSHDIQIKKIPTIFLCKRFIIYWENCKDCKTILDATSSSVLHLLRQDILFAEFPLKLVLTLISFRVAEVEI